MLQSGPFVRDFSPPQAAPQDARKAALQHLLISHLLSDLLREEIPADQIGLTRAGFFARRAYVNERIVELLIEQDEPAEALRYAELAKARALQDVLAFRQSTPSKQPPERSDARDVLADRSPMPGDDLFGLGRAMLHAGARTVVAGLWDVYDGTGPELMHGFFRALAAGRNAPAALAESQRAFVGGLRASKDAEPWLHPYFWAVYSVAGDDRTHFGRESR